MSDEGRFLTVEAIENYRKRFHIGQTVRLGEQETRGRLRRLKGKVIYRSRHFITVMLTKGYKESFLYVDMVLGYVEVL